ncbi:unnamed protein product [Cladocopium goreaui]|uniref:Cation channel sperm-associated protein 1 n=1 Tax=Cladocopium goreaui TaxID=2562237 RepID=A0A9P1BQY9_9DINO|nr:unnamed protein product [Cladocopium goreaui]
MAFTLADSSRFASYTRAGEAAASQRVQGAAHLCFLRKRVLRQAPPLDVIAIAVLELCALFVEDPYVKGCACLCLFALYGRLRASDCNRVSHGRIIGNYFEGCLCRIKTARTLEKQTRFLPVIIPVKGILGVDWFSQFVNARDALGLDAIPDEPPVTTDNDFVLFPSQSTVLASEQERIGSAEMTERLGECLAKLLPTEAFQHYTSHSLKCTLLTYTNIFGLTLEQNELLGYHVVKGHASALNYSRDALASPIRAMATMLGSVKRGLFVPFAARDEQFVSAASAISVRQQFEKSLGITVETAARSIAGVAQGRGPEALDHESFCANLETLAAGIEQDLDKPCHEADTYPVPESSDDEDDSDSSSDSGSTSAESGMAVVDRELAADRYANVNVNADITSDLLRDEKYGMPQRSLGSPEQSSTGKCPLDRCLSCGSSAKLKTKMLDSVAVFKNRALEIGLDEATLARLDVLGWNTFGKLAFASSYRPGQVDESPLITLAEQITEVSPPPLTQLPLIRRLVFESYTLAASDLKMRSERREDDTPRRLAQAERAARHDSQVSRLRGLELTGEMEPSHLLIDLVFQMSEDNQLRYVRWDQCTKRDQELMGLKSDPTWKPDSGGIVREVRVQEEVKADISSDLKLKYALQRRSLAFDQARLVDFDKFERWSQVLLEAYTASPPAGYNKVSIEQVHHADMELFKFLMKETRNGIRPIGTSVPLEDALAKAMSAPEIRLHLQPLQGSSSVKRKAEAEENLDNEKKKKQNQSSGEEKLRRQIQNLEGQLKNMRKGKGKGKGQGARSSSSIKMPQELLGQTAVTAANEPLCFSYNCNGCSKAAAGFKAVAVDHVKRRHQFHACISVDLSNEEGYQFVYDLLKTGAVLYLHCAPPDSTVKNAKEKKLPKKARQHGARAPKPLRISAYPHGLPGLSGCDKLRVTKANQIFSTIAALVRVALQRGTAVTVENLKKSFLWSTTYFKSLIDEGLLHEVSFQKCMWGGKRDQWSSWYASVSDFDILEATCDGNHDHLKWNVTEVPNTWRCAPADAYPSVLCDKVASIVRNMARNCNVQDVSVGPGLKQAKTVPVIMAAAGKQPRGDRFPSLITEFAYTIWKTVAGTFLVTKDKKLTRDQCEALNIPFPAKFLQEKRGVANGVTVDAMREIEVGVWRKPEQFVDRALQIGHPFDDSSGVDDDTKVNIFKLLTEGVLARQQRTDVLLDYYEQRAEVLQHDESLLHDQLDHARSQIVDGKRFLLFEEMCRDVGIIGEDLRLLQLRGVPLTGVDGPTQLFRPEPLKPALTERQLMKSSKWSRKMIMKKTAESPDPDVRSAVWKITMEEVERGWLQGPFDESQVRNMLGPLFVCSKRFGLVQTDKVRQIDNMSESLVNAAYGSSYKLDLEGVDGISVLARTFVEATSDDGVVSVTLKDGSRLVGQLHGDFTVESARSIGGRTLDLDAAYKQVLVAKSSLWCNVLAVEDEHGERRLFDSKRLGLAVTFYALGVKFDFSRASFGVVKVANKASRVEQLVSDIRKFRRESQLTAAAAATFAGKMQFAEKLVIFTDAALEGDDTVGSLGMVAYWAVKGKVTQSYFFSGTVLQGVEVALPQVQLQVSHGVFLYSMIRPGL